MCRGEFGGKEDRPTTTASLINPTHEVGIELPLLIDTGADKTCLSGLDAVRAGIPDLMKADEIAYEEISVEGVDEAEGFRVQEPFILAFEEYSDTHEIWTLHLEFINELIILPKSKQSLLGRDILNRFDISYSPMDGEVVMDRNDYSGGMYICISEEEEIAPQLREFSNDDTEDESSNQ